MVPHVRRAKNSGMHKTPVDARRHGASTPMSPLLVPQVKAGGDPSPTPPRLLDRMRQAIRVRHFAIRTEQTYVDWARRFILFHGKRHPQEMGARPRSRPS